MLHNILTNTAAADIAVAQLLTCMAAALLLGVFLAAVHTYKNTYSKNFILTLILLPAIVQSVILLVNGNVGTGVAVMGAFSLVRFRSAPGNSREISSIFLAMAAGLAVGTGYIGIAALMTVVIGIAMVAVLSLPMGNRSLNKRELKITIPEHLDYSGIFEDIFSSYTRSAELKCVKTVNMGSLYELHYGVDLKSEEKEKQMLDAIRCRNGNLPIVCGRKPDAREEL
ncbi:MAG: DUF4956 domain-containing protein [Hungatella sp.]